MTDLPPPPPVSDEDLSAAVDGLAAPDVVERIAADPSTVGRQRAMTAAATAVGSSVTPLPGATVDHLIANALAAGPGSTGDDQAAAPGPLLAPHGPTPSRRRRLPPTWLVAAVITLVVAVGLTLVWSGIRDGDAGQTTTAASRADTEAGAAGRDGGSAERSGGDTGANATVAGSPSGSGGGAVEQVVDLGRFASAEDLRSTLAAGFPGQQPRRPADPAPPAARLDRCAQQVRVTLNGTQEPPPLGPRPDRQGYARIGDRQVLVYEFVTTSFQAGKSAVVAAVGVDACDPVVTFVH